MSPRLHIVDVVDCKNSCFTYLTLVSAQTASGYRELHLPPTRRPFLHYSVRAFPRTRRRAMTCIVDANKREAPVTNHTRASSRISVRLIRWILPHNHSAFFLCPYLFVAADYGGEGLAPGPLWPQELLLQLVLTAFPHEDQLRTRSPTTAPVHPAERVNGR